MSAVITFFVWLFTGRTKVTFELIRIGAVIMICIFLLHITVSTIRLLWLQHSDRKAIRVISEKGVTPELLSFARRRIDKARSDEDKAREQLVLASYLAEGGFYDRCFEVLREINLTDLSDESQEEYFNIYVYINLMVGDTAAARGIYDGAKMFFDRARLRAGCMPVLHTLGVLEYAEGDYLKAENYLVQACAVSKNKGSVCECEMFLALCYMKTGRARQAIAAAKAAAGHAMTVYQRRKIEGLRAQLEKEYTTEQTEGQTV
ncbi:MAG: hypothetical protein IJ561_07735 [Ruminococcus sp.]|nr:hypothetical protein [Ruminococcus sp.]